MVAKDLHIDPEGLGHGWWGWGRRGVRTFPIVLAIVGLLVILSGHAAARCFGAPETTGAEPAWSLGLRVESAHGLWNLATLGVDERATEGFDAELDVIEPIFERGLDPQEDTIGLYLYFFYPENPATAEGLEDAAATAGLTRSVVHFQDTISWPLRVAYFFPSEFVLTLYWTPEAVNRSNFAFELVTPFDERVPMESESTYSFRATPGFYDFTLSAVSKASPVTQGDLILLTAVLVAYSAGLVGFLWLRRVRRRSASRPKERAKP